MSRRGGLWLALAAMALLLLPALAEAAGGGEVAQVVIVSDTRDLRGIMAWWGDLYNHSHVYFTFLTIIIIPITGMIFGVLADLVMSHIGIDLKSRELAEH